MEKTKWKEQKSTGFTCSVQSTLRNAKHEPSGGLGACPQKIFEKYVAEIGSAWCFLKHKIAMLKTSSGKSAVSEISLTVHARVANPERARASLIL